MNAVYNSPFCVKLDYPSIDLAFVSYVMYLKIYAPLQLQYSSYFILVAWEANVKCSSVGDAKVAAPHSLSG